MLTEAALIRLLWILLGVGVAGIVIRTIARLNAVAHSPDPGVFAVSEVGTALENIVLSTLVFVIARLLVWGITALGQNSSPPQSKR